MSDPSQPPQLPPPPGQAPGPYGAPQPPYGAPRPYVQQQPPPYGVAGGYGQPSHYAPYSPHLSNQPSGPDGLAIGSLVCGILSLPLTFLCYVGIPLAIVAVVLGAISLNKINKSNGTLQGKGMAIGGIVTGVLELVLIVVLVVVIAASFATPSTI